VLDVLVHAGRNAGAAKRFFKRFLKGLQYVPHVLITDKLKSDVGLRHCGTPDRASYTSFRP
jgi:transposase-like protein